MLAAILTALGEWRPLAPIAPRTYLFLALSGLATGASWLCYFRALQLGDAARVAPIDKLSVVLVAMFGVAVPRASGSAANWLGVALIAAGAALAGWKALSCVAQRLRGFASGAFERNAARSSAHRPPPRRAPAADIWLQASPAPFTATSSSSRVEPHAAAVEHIDDIVETTRRPRPDVAER